MGPVDGSRLSLSSIKLSRLTTFKAEILTSISELCQGVPNPSPELNGLTVGLRYVS